jgi:hypothetical protein
MPVAELETKAALEAVARYLDRLLIAHTLEECRELLNRCLAEIAWRRYPHRPWRPF